MAIDLLATFRPQAETVPNRPLTLNIGTTFGPFYISFFKTRAILVGSYTVDPDTGVFTLAAHGMADNTMVQVAALPGQLLTDGLETGALYFISGSDTDTFQLSLTPGGTPVGIAGSEPGSISRCGTPYNFADCSVWAWVKKQASDADGDLVLDLNPSFTGSSLAGVDFQVTFTKAKADTFSLTPGTNVWDLLIEFADGTRQLMIRDGFTIRLPSTHPPL